MRMNNEFVNELKRKRKELGLTQIQVAKAIGVSRRTYQTYEETNHFNDTYNEILRKLNEMGDPDGTNHILSVKTIKRVCGELFKEEYPEVECAYLFGSYARGEATSSSDIDILVVCPPMGMKFYAIAALLEERLHKEIDLHTHRQLSENAEFLRQILKDGIKIYG